MRFEIHYWFLVKSSASKGNAPQARKNRALWRFKGQNIYLLSKSESKTSLHYFSIYTTLPLPGWFAAASVAAEHKE